MSDNTPVDEETDLPGNTGHVKATSRVAATDWYVITARTFASDWFRDAQREAADTTGDPDARRREVIFAALCAESYLVEWMVQRLRFHMAEQSDVNGEARRIFADLRKQGYATAALWNEVPRRLADDRVIPPLLRDPSLDTWADFERLIEMRNDLTHANISHVEFVGPGGSAYPPLRTSPTDLEGLGPGWATKTVADRILGLYRQTKSFFPSWVVAST